MQIGKKPQCVKFRVDQETAVRKAKPAFIRVYDYYDTGRFIFFGCDYSRI